MGDTEERRRYLNARQTIATLLAERAIPVVNENDTVATSEIRFGDNDRLSARVASMMTADCLVLLSDIDGLYTAPPGSGVEARRLDEVRQITPEIEAMAGSAGTELSRGGMVTKIEAARIALASGTNMVISSGKVLHPLRALSEGAACTWFLAPSDPVTARKRWIAGQLEPKGAVEIDAGAEKALLTGKSLLPAGVKRVDGSFERGDAVIIRGPSGRELGRGLVAYARGDAERIIGRKSSEIAAILGHAGRTELVHRNDMVLSRTNKEMNATPKRKPETLADVTEAMRRSAPAHALLRRTWRSRRRRRRTPRLLAAARELRARTAPILEADRLDLAAAEEAGRPAAFIDRLMLDTERIEAMAEGLEDIASLPDPVGSVLAQWTRPNGLRIERVRVPLGVIGIIYESRPNVTADAGALCLKAGNAAILRGGSESHHSSRAIQLCLARGLREAGLPEAAIQLVPTTDREAVGLMLKGLDGSIDVIVPRGGKSLVARVQEEARVPVFAHLEGICHTYVDRSADLEMAKRIVVNAKLRRTGVCGATETLLVDKAAPAGMVKALVAALLEAGCEVRGDAAAREGRSQGAACY